MWMISSLVMDANRDAIFSSCLEVNAKDIRSLTNQSVHAFNAIHYFSIYTNTRI